MEALFISTANNWCSSNGCVLGILREGSLASLLFLLLILIVGFQLVTEWMFLLYRGVM